jgi:hypothetical protein
MGYYSGMARPTDRPDGKARRVPVRFMLTDDEHEALQRCADEHGLSIAALTRGTALEAVGYQDPNTLVTAGAAT